MLGLTKPSPMSSTPPPAGSTGTTTAGSTAPSEWSRPPNTSKPTTLPSTRRSSPHENGTKAVTLQDALTEQLADLPPALRRSITWDQGTEMARHLEISRSLGAPVYFCDSHSPWQRGSNENMNGLLRDYFPKGTDLSQHSPRHLLAVEDELNHRPRQVLGDRARVD